MGLNEMLSEWARKRVGLQWPWKDCQTVSLWDDESGSPEVVAVVVYEGYDGRSVNTHIAAVPGKRWMTKLYLHSIFSYPFELLKCERITGLVSDANVDSKRLVEHFGFVREGCIRRASPDGSDLIVYGMLREECRFLEMRNGKKQAA